MSLQPTELDFDRLGEIIQGEIHLDGPLLPILHAIQHEYGFIPPNAVGAVALALNLSRAEVFGVVSFYSDFRQEPAGRRTLKLCQAEACQARGAREVDARARSVLGVASGSTTLAGEMTLETVYCLGLCASGPAALLDDQPIGRLTPDRIEALIAESVA
jgi:formate dehydrogenase subunit gamma